jgi:hypothetical protein
MKSCLRHAFHKTRQVCARAETCFRSRADAIEQFTEVAILNKYVVFLMLCRPSVAENDSGRPRMS